MSRLKVTKIINCPYISLTGIQLVLFWNPRMYPWTWKWKFWRTHCCKSTKKAM